MADFEFNPSKDAPYPLALKEKYDLNKSNTIDSRELKTAAQNLQAAELIDFAASNISSSERSSFQKDLQATITEAGAGARRQALDIMPIFPERISALREILNSLKALPDSADPALHANLLDRNSAPTPSARYYAQFDVDRNNRIDLSELKNAELKGEAGRLLLRSGSDLYLKGFDIDVVSKHLASIARMAGQETIAQLLEFRPYPIAEENILEQTKKILLAQYKPEALHFFESIAIEGQDQDKLLLMSNKAASDGLEQLNLAAMLFGENWKSDFAKELIRDPKNDLALTAAQLEQFACDLELVVSARCAGRMVASKVELAELSIADLEEQSDEVFRHLSSGKSSFQGFRTAALLNRENGSDLIPYTVIESFKQGYMEHRTNSVPSKLRADLPPEDSALALKALKYMFELEIELLTSH